MSLWDLLSEHDGAAPALLDVAGAALDFGALRQTIGDAAAALRAHGVGPSDAVAIVMPAGPELATTFMAAALAGVAAPLNPAYRDEELAFYLADLGARVVLVGPPAQDAASPVRAVAARLGVRVIEVRGGARPGQLSFDGAAPEPNAQRPSPRAEDVALVLHTSGTTGRPKRVPLSHANLVASARNVAATLRLGPADRGLELMPLFHIHGLVAGLLAPLAAGGAVVVAPGFFAAEVPGWLERHRATWYTAVPTMHQAILARLAEGATWPHLRFVRSSSSALPRRTLHDLEARLGVPVIEAYGMTEAAHQIASNPLPAGARKPGSVGPAAGPEVAVLDAEGRAVAVGERGEVAIRGPNVTLGYLGSAPLAAGEWLRTGDEGVLDGDGYLTLTGRLKEQINRGGEKVMPLEIDEVLMAHPAVAQALAFALPHAELGEDVAAAVVLKPGAVADERALRAHVAERLAYFKIPRRVVIVPALPLGPSGKPQRLGLAQRLGVDTPAGGSSASSVAGAAGVSGASDASDASVTSGPSGTSGASEAPLAPRTPLEEIVALGWSETVGAPPPTMTADFFACGGDSIALMRLIVRLQEQLAIELALIDVLDAATVAGIAAVLEAALAREGA